MVLTMNDQFYRQRAAMAGRRVRRESDARRDLERMHLMTIRREKMRLQEELDKVRIKGQAKGARVNATRNNHAVRNARMLSTRFSMMPANQDDDGITQQRGRRSRLNTAGASPNPRARSPYAVTRTATVGSLLSTDNELPLIAQTPTPVKVELELRKQKDEQRDPNTKLHELKANEGRQKNLLALKVDMFNRSLTPISPARSPSARSPARSPVPSPPDKNRDLYDLDILSDDYELKAKKHESDLETRATFPPPSKRRFHHPNEAEDALPHIPNAQISHPPPHPPRRPSIIRRQSQVAILERKDKKNKYAANHANGGGGGSSDSGKDNSGPKRNVESDLNLAVLNRDAKRVKEIIENPQIVFDQEKYAPDGALRTVHMLPDASSAYSQARQARYLRWRDPNELEKERELDIDEIFSKGKNGY